MEKKLNINLLLFSYPLIQTCVLGAQKIFSLRRFFRVPTTYVLVDLFCLFV